MTVVTTAAYSWDCLSFGRRRPCPQSFASPTPEQMSLAGGQAQSQCPPPPTLGTGTVGTGTHCRERGQCSRGSAAVRKPAQALSRPGSQRRGSPPGPPRLLWGLVPSLRTVLDGCWWRCLEPGKAGQHLREPVDVRASHAARGGSAPGVCKEGPCCLRRRPAASSEPTANWGGGL